MTDTAKVFGSSGIESRSVDPTGEPCVMVIFGASGDLTKRLLVPALYNLACDGLLSENFAVIGSGRSDFSDEKFRELMGGADGLRAFHTRKEFDEAQCEKLLSRFHFHTGNINVEDFKELRKRVAELDEQFGAGGNVLFYCAMAPKFFGPLCDTLYEAGFQDGPGWKRIIVEKPFGPDLESARTLNTEILKHWPGHQI